MDQSVILRHKIANATLTPVAIDIQRHGGSANYEHEERERRVADKGAWQHRVGGLRLSDGAVGDGRVERWRRSRRWARTGD